MVHTFDDSNIVWRRLDWLDHVEFYVYKADRENRIVDVLFRFGANTKAMLHQHKTPYVTFVVQGELRFYTPSGELKEVRPVGSYVSGVASGEPHLEGGGDEDAIVFFSNRNVQDVLYEFLDEDLHPVVILRFEDFEAQLRAQGKPNW